MITNALPHNNENINQNESEKNIPYHALAMEHDG